MCRAEQYGDIYEALQARGSRLLTSPSEYVRAHHFPGWYKQFEQLTPFSVWGDEPELLCEQIQGAAIVKDWVKSAKHRWEQACYIPNTQDLPHALRVAAALREIRGDDFTGSFVLREFEHFNGVQARTWWLKDEMRLAGPHPDHPDQLTTCTDTAFLGELQRAVARMDCAFITVDIAQRTDGVWRVVEVGDGGVSDRASSIPADSFIGAVTDEG